MKLEIKISFEKYKYLFENKVKAKDEKYMSNNKTLNFRYNVAYGIIY